MKQLDEMTPEEIRIEIAMRKEWVCPHDEEYTHYVSRSMAIDAGDIGLEGYPIQETIFVEGDGEPPNWPEDIAAAWELVEDSQAKPHELYFDIEAIICVSNKWRATVGYYSRIGLTAPLAICRAWLAWKRSEE